jgi:hypothetical protein
MGTAISFCSMFSTPLSLSHHGFLKACPYPVPVSRPSWWHHAMKLVWEQHQNYIRTRREQLGNVMWTWLEHHNKVMATLLEHGNSMGMWKLNMRTTSFVNTYSSTLEDYAIHCSTPGRLFLQRTSLAISLCRASNKNTYGGDRDSNTKHDRVSTGLVRPGGVRDRPSSSDFFLTLMSRDNIFMAWDGDKNLMLKSMGPAAVGSICWMSSA